MNMGTVRWKVIAWWTGALIAVAAAVYGIAVFSAPAESPENSANASDTVAASTTVTNVIPGSNGSSTASAVPPPSSPGNGGNNIPALPGPAITIHLITPISGNVWTIGGTNPIAWDNPADITGEIELVNAVTKTFIGVILSETGPNQTSYSWNARSIALSRYGADQKDVAPGTYSIRIHFDGNGLGDLVSGPITITD
jgi:hypothetical protein